MIYKRNVNGSVQFWKYEVDGGKYRTVTGKIDGKEVFSEWTICEPKNVGKANETSAEEQALKEAQALERKKLEKEYMPTLESIDKTDYIKPMLAHTYEENVTFPVYSQPKLDGIRCIATKDALWTRNGKKIESCGHIHEALYNFFKKYPDAILDGELYNHDLKEDFNTITSLVRRVKVSAEEKQAVESLIQYHVYDYPSNNTTFFDRYFTMTMQFRAVQIDSNIIRTVSTLDCLDQVELDNLYDKYFEQGYEGQMVRMDKPYQNKRSKFLLKRKEFDTEEFQVLSIVEGLGNWSGRAKSIELMNPKTNKNFHSGIRGTFDYCEKILEDSKKGVVPNIATVRFKGYTPDGVPRFPVVIDFDRNE